MTCGVAHFKLGCRVLFDALKLLHYHYIICPTYSIKVHGYVRSLWKSGNSKTSQYICYYRLLLEAFANISIWLYLYHFVWVVGNFWAYTVCTPQRPLIPQLMMSFTTPNTPYLHHAPYYGIFLYFIGCSSYLDLFSLHSCRGYTLYFCIHIHVRHFKLHLTTIMCPLYDGFCLIGWEYSLY